MSERNAFFFNQLYMGRWTKVGHPYWGGTVFRHAFGKWSTSLSILPQVSDPIFNTIISDNGAKVQLKLVPSNPRGVRKHRVFVLCHKCDTWVPAGRVHQHRC